MRAQGVSPFTRSVYDAAELSIDNGYGHSRDTNDGGRYSFSTSAAMRSYVNMYRATGDTFYVDKLIRAADNVLANRDDVTLRFAAPEQAPAWTEGAGAFAPYQGAAYTSGIIIQPMVAFSRLVSENPALAANPVYSAKAAEYIDRSRETIAFINNNFLHGGGYSPFLDRVQGFGPHLDLTMAGVMRDFAGVVGGVEGQQFLSTVDRIQRQVVDNAFYTTPQGNLAWEYNTLDTSVIVPEDFSHGGIAAAPLARLAVEDGSVITREIGRALAKTIIEESYLGGGNVAGGFAGSDGTTAIPEARRNDTQAQWAWGIAGGFINLAQFDLRLLPIAEEVHLEQFGLTVSNNSARLLGISNLFRYSAVPQELLLDVTVGEYQTTEAFSVGLFGPTEVLLVNADGDEQILTIELGGGGDEWLEEWDLSVLIDAFTAPDLTGQDVDFLFSFLDRNGEIKQITDGQSPTGFASTIDSRGENVLLGGVLQSSQQFTFRVLELGVATVPEPTSCVLLAMVGLMLSMRRSRLSPTLA